MFVFGFQSTKTVSVAASCCCHSATLYGKNFPCVYLQVYAILLTVCLFFGVITELKWLGCDIYLYMLKREILDGIAEECVFVVRSLC